MAHPSAPVEHGHRQKGESPVHRQGDAEPSETHIPDTLNQVGNSHGFGDVGKGLEDAQAFRRHPEQFRLLASQPGGQEALHPVLMVEQGHHAVAGASQGPGGVQRPLEDTIEVEALVDAEAGLAEPRQTLLQGLDLPVPVV